jgi:hypothetical protein
MKIGYPRDKEAGDGKWEGKGNYTRTENPTINSKVRYARVSRS